MLYLYLFGVLLWLVYGTCLWNDDSFHTPHNLKCTGNMPGNCMYSDKMEVRQNRSTSEPNNCSQLKV